mmetsp:Transcript_18516/g.49670  ORF Transcript_18516/g.49670 Transcript_18516/m.49670 type:complete len:225 (+) Transcript_18516:302-976(+)
MIRTCRETSQATVRDVASPAHPPACHRGRSTTGAGLAQFSRPQDPGSLRFEGPTPFPSLCLVPCHHCPNHLPFPCLRHSNLSIRRVPCLSRPNPNPAPSSTYHSASLVACLRHSNHLVVPGDLHGPHAFGRHGNRGDHAIGRGRGFCPCPFPSLFPFLSTLPSPSLSPSPDPCRDPCLAPSPYPFLDPFPDLVLFPSPDPCRGPSLFRAPCLGPSPCPGPCVSL